MQEFWIVIQIVDCIKEQVLIMDLIDMFLIFIIDKCKIFGDKDYKIYMVYLNMMESIYLIINQAYLDLVNLLLLLNVMPMIIYLLLL